MKAYTPSTIMTTAGMTKSNFPTFELYRLLFFIVPTPPIRGLINILEKEIRYSWVVRTMAILLNYSSLLC